MTSPDIPLAIPEGFDWKNPEYERVMLDRAERLTRLREDPRLVVKAKEFYKDHPAHFIHDWGFTVDPRNAEIGRATVMPFLLFPKQQDFVDWLLAGWKERDDGLAEKSRDMGVTWLCVGFAVWMFLFYPGSVVGFGSRKEEYVDKIGDPKSIFWKAREFIRLLPAEFKPAGWNTSKHCAFMRIVNPENGASIVGEAGDNIGRGNRTSIYFVDESAFIEHQEEVDNALSQTTNCRVDVSTPNGAGNLFYRKRHGGKIPVFIFAWQEDPRKDQAWYDAQVAKADSPVTVAQEIDRDYEASVSDSWIPGELVNAAQARGPADVQAIGKLMVGVDPARFGDDETVITFRRGRVLIRQVALRKLDVEAVAGRVKLEIQAFKEAPGQIAVDTIGIGSGVADILRGKGNYPDVIVGTTVVKTVVDVSSALQLGNGLSYNLRAQMARDVKEWLKGASIPKDPKLRSDLTALRYGFRAGELLMESKEQAKKRGVKSPDRFDSLALTFAYPLIEAPEMPVLPGYEPAVDGVM